MHIYVCMYGFIISYILAIMITINNICGGSPYLHFTIFHPYIHSYFYFCMFPCCNEFSENKASHACVVGICTYKKEEHHTTNFFQPR